MRDNPRYSIIPAGAVTDPRIERGDLQVLALLGCHTDKLGWVEASSQSTLATMIKCSRQTFQRSISRLVTAGWVQAKTKFVSESGRPYAPYAYRVIMDRDEPEIQPAEFEVAGEIDGEGAHGRAPLPMGEQGVPIVAGHGCPRMHGHQRTDLEETKKLEVVETRAREPLVSAEANRVAEEIAALAGFPDRINWPPGWCGAPYRVDAFLREGYHPDILLLAVREVMAGRKAGADPPWSIGYFERQFAKARARQQQGLPTVTIQKPQEVAINGAVSIHSDKSATAAALRSMRRSMDRRANSLSDVGLPQGRLRQSGYVRGAGENEPAEISSGDRRIRDRSDDGDSG